MSDFVSGAFVMAAAAVVLFFFRYWRQSGDRLFLVFAAAFLLLAVERTVLAFVPRELDGRHLVFLARMAAFLLIIAGIIDKNRPRRRRSS